jgi:hypothetical protein
VYTQFISTELEGILCIGGTCPDGKLVYTPTTTEAVIVMVDSDGCNAFTFTLSVEAEGASCAATVAPPAIGVAPAVHTHSDACMGVPQITPSPSASPSDGGSCQGLVSTCEVNYSFAPASKGKGGKGKSSVPTPGIPVCINTDPDEEAYTTVCVDPAELEDLVDVPFMCDCCSPVLQGGLYPSYCTDLICAEDPMPCDFPVPSGKGGGKGRKLREVREARGLFSSNVGKGSKSKEPEEGVAVCFEGETLCLNELDPADVLKPAFEGVECGAC